MKNNSNVQKIAQQIKDLVDQLVILSGEKSETKSSTKTVASVATKKGASGALAMLTDEGFFNEPREISVIMEKLKEVGRYYPQPSVSMNLLNLTRRRIFTRLSDKETNKYLYVLKK